MPETLNGADRENLSERPDERRSADVPLQSLPAREEILGGLRDLERGLVRSVPDARPSARAPQTLAELIERLKGLQGLAYRAMQAQERERDGQLQRAAELRRSFRLQLDPEKVTVSSAPAAPPAPDPERDASRQSQLVSLPNEVRPAGEQERELAGLEARLAARPTESPFRETLWLEFKLDLLRSLRLWSEFLRFPPAPEAQQRLERVRQLLLAEYNQRWHSLLQRRFPGSPVGLHPGTPGLLTYAELTRLIETWPRLVQVAEAVEWLNAHGAADLCQREVRRLTEAVVAATAHLFDRLRAVAADEGVRARLGRDDSLVALRSWALGIANSREVRVNTRMTPEQAAEDGARLPQIFQELVESVASRTGRADCLAAALAAAAAVREGWTEARAARLVETLKAAMKAGVPPSHKELRESLGGLETLLADEPELARLQHEALAAARPEPEEEPDLGLGGGRLDAAAWEKLDQVLAHTRGRRAVMLGGDPSRAREKRLELESVLELAELDWLPVQRGESLQRYYPALAGQDLVIYVVSWLQHSGLRELQREAKSYGARPIYLNRGLGLSRVIHQLWEQLCAPGAGRA